MTFDEVRELALALPETVESTAYGTPCFPWLGRAPKRLGAADEAEPLGEGRKEL